MSNRSDCTPIYANASQLCLSPLSHAAAQCLSDDEASGILGDYLVFWRCTVDGSLLSLFFLVPYLIMLLVGLGSTADNFLMPQLTVLSKLLRLSPDVAGVTLLAVGNAAPDVFSAVAVATSDLRSSKQELDLSFMMSDIIGGTLFIMTVVVGSVVWVAGKRAPGWTIGKLPFWRDLVMLVIAATFVLVVGTDGSINLLEACCLLLLHVVYISIVLLLPKIVARCKPRTLPAATGQQHGGAAASPLSDGLLRNSTVSSSQLPMPAAPAAEASSAFPDPELSQASSVQHAAVLKPLRAAREPMDGLDWPPRGSSCVSFALHILELPLSILRWCTIPASDGNWDRSRRVWNCATPMLGALLFTTQVYSDIYGAAAARVGSSPMPMALLWLLLGCLASLGLWLSTEDVSPPRWYPVLVGLGFVMTIVWLKILAGEAIALLETVGHLLNISTSILGLTVMAIGNSIGDFVADTAAAREGTVGGARMGLAACFGSPVIMNIVSVGVAFTLRLALTGGHPITYGPLSKLTRLGYLLFYWTIFSHCVIFPLGGYRVPRLYGLYLLLIYALLLTLSCLIEVGVLEANWLCTAFSFMFGKCGA